MTTDTKVETAVSAKARGYRYVRSDSVAVVSVSGERNAPSTSLRTVLQACFARFEVFLHGWLRALPEDRVLLFAATPLSAQHNVISRRRGIWGTDGLNWLPASVSRSPSVEIRGEEGVTRFAGLAEIAQANFFEAADFARMRDDSFLLVSPRQELTENRVRSMVAKVFPRGESAVDWTGVVAQVEEGEDICIRASGAFDDREASIDAFLSDNLLRRLGAP